ncbi:PTS system trehalose-specific IIBC component [Spiroplasma helicoides]|uniref:PTS system trehalose-specific IIBC component n=1 Tax=Spiroplasma helicoides TaxID=216938 RepID=A0A1B3SJB9_9MOLU|nr:PTS transporter subunit EIIC [Spiroplasma helicoides]AOG60025.1 PTS system trehalose-specific IIBC component [Spiroplasma helicoides]
MKIFSSKRNIDKDVSLIADYFGGSENIENVSHCATRMRIRVKNIELVKLDEIEKLELVSGTIAKENLVQFVVKTNLEEFNKDFLITLGVSLKRVPNLFDVKLTVKKNFFKTVTDGIGVLVKPIIPYLITLSIISTFANIINNIEVKGSTIKDTGEVAATMGKMFASLQNAMTLAFSILIPWSVFKMMRGSQAIGISIGVVLCAKDFAQTNDFMSGNKGLFDWGQSYVDSNGVETSWSFSSFESGYPWKISYQGQILPLVLIAFMAVYLERLVRKIKYGVVKELLGIPLVTLVSFFVGLLILAPIGMLITYGMNVGVLWASTHRIAKYIFNPLFGILLPWLVVTGFIQIFVVVSLQQFMTYGAISINAMFTQLNIAVATSCLVFAVMNRQNKELQKTAVPSYLIAFIGGSTEPALFGVTLRFLFPVIAASIGTTVGIVITTMSDVLTTMGPASFLVFLCIIPYAQDPQYAAFNMTTWAPGGFFWMAIALVATIGTTVLATILLSRVNYFKKMTKSILDRDFAPIPGAEIITNKIKNKKEKVKKVGKENE